MKKTAREGTPVPKKKRWRVQNKRKEKKWKRKKRKKMIKVKHRRNLWWTQRKEQFASFFVSESPRRKQFLGRFGRWLFLLLILMQNWFCRCAAGRLEPEGEAEVPELFVVSDAVEGTPVDLGGESRHEQVEAKLFEKRKRDAQ